MATGHAAFAPTPREVSAQMLPARLSPAAAAEQSHFPGPGECRPPPCPLPLHLADQCSSPGERWLRPRAGRGQMPSPALIGQGEASWDGRTSHRTLCPIWTTSNTVGFCVRPQAPPAALQGTASHPAWWRRSRPSRPRGGNRKSFPGCKSGTKSPRLWRDGHTWNGSTCCCHGKRGRLGGVCAALTCRLLPRAVRVGAGHPMGRGPGAAQAAAASSPGPFRPHSREQLPSHVPVPVPYLRWCWDSPTAPRASCSSEGPGSIPLHSLFPWDFPCPAAGSKDTQRHRSIPARCQQRGRTAVPQPQPAVSKGTG